MSRAQTRLHEQWSGERADLITAFRESGNPLLEKRAEKIDGCCHSPHLCKDSAGRPRLMLQCCRDRMCPRCQKQRGVTAARAITTLVSGWDSARFITLTLLHRNASLVEELLRLMTCFKALRKDPYWRANVRSGVYSIEVTRNFRHNQWHVHLHLIVSGEFIAQKKLSQLWKRVTGDSEVVDIRAVHSRESTASYVASYVSKAKDFYRFSPAEMCEYALAMHGRRLLHTFGKAHGKSVDPKPEEDAPKQAEYVAPLDWITKAAERGCELAQRATEILCRLGGTWSRAAGFLPPPANTPSVPVEEWELHFLFDVGTRVYSAGWENAAEILRPRETEAPPPDVPEQMMLIDVTESRCALAGHL